MVVVYGTRFTGKVATLNNQWIETKFFSIMFIPIFPVGSMLVTSSGFRKRMGLHIATNNKSVIAAYVRVFTLLMSIWMLYSVFAVLDDFEGQGPVIWYAIKFIIFASLWGYFSFFYGRVTTDDKIARTKVGSITGVYALPHWFDHAYLRNKLRDFLLEYKMKNPEGDWKADLRANPVAAGKIKLLFAIALFNCMVYDIPENDELYARANDLYEPYPDEAPFIPAAEPRGIKLR